MLNLRYFLGFPFEGNQLANNCPRGLDGWQYSTINGREHDLIGWQIRRYPIHPPAKN